MLPGLQVPVFIVQNSPIFDPTRITNKERKDFIFSGTARTVFGIFDCIEFIRNYPPSRLVQKGGGERKVLTRIRSENVDLIRDDRLVLDDSYVPAGELISFLSGFRIGFCFYSWKIIEDFFNYRTAPSGKLFMYMAAGVPVIASDIEGFRMVREYGAGVLIRDYSPNTIMKAVKEIESDFEQYSRNCLKMASDLSFDKLVAPYIDFLLSFDHTIST
jgi:glycosyltransferase involved in cell wall biosynthesis